MHDRAVGLCRHLGILVCLLAGSTVAPLAQSVCDPSKPTASDPWDRYHERDGDRCEGVYGEQPVSGDIIGEIASFTLGKPAYQLDLTPLTLEWPGPTPGPVQVRAVALREDLLYQMDTVRPAGASSYAWPSDVLAYRKIEPDELGVRAWVEQRLLGRARPLHLPLRVGQGGGDTGVEALPRYWLVIVPGAPLRSLEIAVDRLEAVAGEASAEPGGGVGTLREVIPYQSLNRGYYAAKRAVRVALPVINDPGNYRLRLRAERDGDGELDGESFWFAHAVP